MDHKKPDESKDAPATPFPPFAIQVDRVYRIENNAFLKGFVDITISGLLLVKSIRILNGASGLFASMPQDQAKDKRWYDSVRCLTPEIRDEINKKCLEAYLDKEKYQ